MTINYGIDLGTTNSAIACYEKGKVRVFSHPANRKLSLPSVVAFRKDRWLIGDKAREYLLSAPASVAAGFKRKMGSSELYQIEGVEGGKSPVQLSSEILKELKTFLPPGEVPRAAVITIPASFDTIQSNATKEAGKLAGFEQVILLQEPVAASLAFANKEEDTPEEVEGKWLVYDLGGGTFDVALVRVKDGEIRVLDHEGDNFLGGNDFDQAIVEEFVIPAMMGEGTFEDLLKQMKSASGRYNRLYHKLLFLCEEAKKELSASDSAWIEFSVADDADNVLDFELELQRDTFENIIKGRLDETISMCQRLVDRNELAAANLKYILMVGGSTCIPYVQKRLADKLGVKVNNSVDPITAVAAGAAFFAGTQALEVSSGLFDEGFDSAQPDIEISVRTAYAKVSQDDEEYFTAKFEGAWKSLFYRITRRDGGYDSGLKPTTEQISESLPLVSDSFNYFELKIYDVLGNSVPLEIETIGISQGKYALAGQPLPHDICLEVDDLESGSTALEVIFSKNDILPLQKTFTKTVTRTLQKDSDDTLTIHVLEGPGYALPAANQPIGFISISGNKLSRDLLKGSDIEITLEMSASRDLKISTWLMMTDQEFEDAFNPAQRHVSVARLFEDICLLLEKLQDEVADARDIENYGLAQELLDYEKELQDLADKVAGMSEDDVTDEKFQIEDRKRKLAQKVDLLTRDKLIERAKMDYFEAKRDIEYSMQRYTLEGSDLDAYNHILQREKEQLASNNVRQIKSVVSSIRDIIHRLSLKDPIYLRHLFYSLRMSLDEMSDRNKARRIIQAGEDAISAERWEDVLIFIHQLANLLPEAQRDAIVKGGTGIG